MPLLAPAPLSPANHQEVQRFIGQLPRPPRVAPQQPPSAPPAPAPRPERAGDGGGPAGLPSGRIAEVPEPAREHGSAGMGGGAPAEITNQELDRLATQLYSRLRNRLVNELRLDRERSGRLSDPW